MSFIRLALPFFLVVASARAETFGETTIRARPAPSRLPIAQSAQIGQVPLAAQTSDARILANEPDGQAGLTLSFDASGLQQTTTPLALLQISAGAVVVKGHFTGSAGHMGALRVYLRRPGMADPVLAGSTLTPPRRATPTLTTVDVTAAVNAALAAPGGPRQLVFELSLGGKPGYCPVYRLADPAPYLAIFPPNRGTDVEVAAQRAIPVTSGPTVYREPCLLMTETRGSPVTARLLYPAARVREVIRDADGKRLIEGHDWVLQRGQVVFPAATDAPVQFGPEFFVAPPPKPGAKAEPATPRRTALRLEATDETWYRDRQVEITYDPATRDWSWPAPASSLTQLPGLARKFAAHQPIKIVHFGDSISFGHNASSIGAVPPYQPVWGDIVAREIERRRGVSVLYLNHSHSGGTSQWGALSADGLVAAEKPDLVILAFGMNDRAAARQAVYKANLESIIDTVRTTSPKTEFLIVSTMMNNPAQPLGTAPVMQIRDLTLSVNRPGIAFADVTIAEKALLERKNYLDLTGNGANHPNDFLIGVYAQRVLEVLAPFSTGR
jgi:acyl-CoA thioesterase-1